MALDVVKSDTNPSRRRRQKSGGSERQAEATTRYTSCRRSGGRLGSLAPVFSKDEKYVFLCTKSEPRVYSATTGELIRSLSGKRSHKSPIVALFLHPTNEFRLITVTLAGQATVWDWTDGAVLQSMKLECDGEIVSAALLGSTLFWTDGRQIFACKDFPKLVASSRIARLAVCFGIIAYKDRVCAYGDKQVLLFTVDEAKAATHDHEYLTLPSAIVSLTATNDAFAYADASGSIYLYQIAGHGKTKEATPRKLHWHSSAVSSLQFALNGEYLISGGDEGVLVLWQLNSSNKQFLPRIAHKIERIAVSPSSKFYAVKLNDNTVKILTASSLGLQAEVVCPRYTGGTMTSAIAGDDVLLCNAAEVQVWNIVTGRSSLRVPVTSQTYAGRVNEQYRTNEPLVSYCASHGAWLATLDSWTSPREESVDLGLLHSMEETYLKFWNWTGKDYDLITRIDNPHGDHKVTQILAVSDETFYTAGDDAAVKIWRQKPLKKDLIGGGTKVVGTTWSCRRVIKFSRSRGGCKMALARDGSVLAVHTSDQTFLIDPISGNLRSTLSGLSTGRVKHIAFVSDSLVILGHKRLVVWDLLRATVAYALRIPETTSELHLVAGHRNFMLGTHEQSKGIKSNDKIFIFDSQSPKPVFREKCAKTLTLNWSAKHGFIQVDANLDISCYADTAVDTPVEQLSIASGISAEPPTGISLVYRPISNKKAAARLDEADMQEFVLNGQSVATLFEDSMQSLEERFENLAGLVLGAPAATFVN